MYECRQEESILTCGFLTIAAAFIFSPWTLIDGTLGSLLAQLASETGFFLLDKPFQIKATKSTRPLTEQSGIFLSGHSLMPPGICTEFLDDDDGVTSLSGILTSVSLNFFVLLSSWYVKLMGLLLFSSS